MAIRVLLIEDDPSIRETTTMGLEAAGFAVASARDGAEGMQRFRAEQPDVVLLDLMLPVLDGLEVCRRIRAESPVPVVMLTARSSTEDVISGLEAGADDYLRKPFEMAELIARLRAATRRSRAIGPAEVLHLGPLTIDVHGHSVTRDGRDVALTHREFQLLVELARRPGQVFTRELLLERIWGYDYLGDSRLVDICVQRLRAKVEVDPPHPGLILTVRGAGYKAQR
ncbi:MAG: response regulator transcription factor [Chloroflexi bacterium]|jgi:two-component system response regulator MtrA|nr:response regulator transcription factor [Chloroflexota bacterium]